jgi:inorganic pyrophosphatase
MKNKKITNAEYFLGKKVKIIFDPPLGTRHEKYKNLIYELNYGFIPNTISGDGEELDAYYLSSDIPLKEAKGICIAYIKRENENDDKLIVTQKNEIYSDEEILKKINFCEQYFIVKIFRK